MLVAWGSLLEAVKKFLAALQVRWRQVPVIIGEPGQQVIVFNSFHNISF
jgi:hypothetical protein